jgi:hypothetical protein
MNEPTPTHAPIEPAYLRTAVILGVLLLAGLGSALFFVTRDNAHRSEIETVVESSAVGDTRYFTIPDPLPPEPYPPVAHLNGKALIPAGYKRHEKRETEMQPIGRDEATGLTIYQAPVKAKEAAEPPTYFLKVGRGEFLKLRPASEE